MIRNLLVAALLVGPTAWKDQAQEQEDDQGCGGAGDAQAPPADEEYPLGADASAPPATDAGAAPAPMGLIRTSGDVHGYLENISYGGDGDGIWQPSSRATMEGFSSALRALLLGDLADASTRAMRIGFQVIEHSDPQRGIFYILRSAPGKDGPSPGGTYVWNPRARVPLVVEVPHPAHDGGTDAQGIELFLAAEATLLLLSGTHRYSDLAPSTCQRTGDSKLRRSDPAHSVDHLFHLAHVQAEDTLDQPLFIQLHGVGDQAYEKLKNQCKHRPGENDPELLINVSEGFHKRRKPKDGPPDSFAYRLAEMVNQDGTIKACLFHQDTHIYGGTRNVQGRYTNGSPDPCNEHGTHNSGRFVHVEQSNDVRQSYRILLRTLILDTLTVYYD